jgi:hypothetical protein
MRYAPLLTESIGCTALVGRRRAVTANVIRVWRITAELAARSVRAMTNPRLLRMWGDNHDRPAQ